MKEPLVTVLTPSYNGAKLIHRLLDSVLGQTYPNIEMIVVDDGSTDNSEEVIKGYIPKFEEKGYTLQYMYQENGGQSVAINNGLKHVKGKYLTWPDSDDWFATPDAISKLANALENSSDEVGMVRSQEMVINESDLSVIYTRGVDFKTPSRRQFFEDCMFCGNGFYFTPGAYMIKFDFFKKVNGLDIYTEHDAGQNWQMMLPMLYNFDCLHINEPLFSVLERNGSHSRLMELRYDKFMNQRRFYENTVLATLDLMKNMPESDRKEYKLRVERKYNAERLKLAYDFRERSDFKKYWLKGIDRLKETPTLKEKVRYLVVRVHAENLLGFAARVKNKFVSCFR